MDDRVRAVLTDATDVSITALPDGSVDHRYRVLGPSGVTLSRDEFATRLLEGTKTFLLENVATEPGGMAVNAASQVDALGAEARLLGHLDHDVFEALQFQTASMGGPADVKIYEFVESAVMLTDESRALETWTYHDLQKALDHRTTNWFDADAIICSNWSSVPNVTGVLEDIASSDLGNGWFIVDPGDVTIRPTSDIVDLLEVLGVLDQSFNVVLNPNDVEVAAIGAALDLDASTIPDRLSEIRTAAGITACMVHAEPEAAVATAEGVVRVPNYDSRRPVRFTGGGDHFTGGLAVALATGADWDVALRLANACATHYVGRGETPTVDVLREFPPLAGRRPSTDPG